MITEIEVIPIPDVEGMQKHFDFDTWSECVEEARYPR